MRIFLFRNLSMTVILLNQKSTLKQLINRSWLKSAEGNQCQKDNYLLWVE